MKDLIIKIKVKDDLMAYKLVSRLSFMSEVSEVKYKGKIWKFDKKDETKKPKHFLSDNFGKEK